MPRSPGWFATPECEKSPIALFSDFTPRCPASTYAAPTSAAASSVHAALTSFLQNGERRAMRDPASANGRAMSDRNLRYAAAVELSMFGTFSPIAITT